MINEPSVFELLKFDCILLTMNSLNKTESSVFVYQKCFVLPKDPYFHNLYIFTKAGVKYYVVATNIFLYFNLLLDPHKIQNSTDPSTKVVFRTCPTID